MTGITGMYIHNNHPNEYFRVLTRRTPKGKFKMNATNPMPRSPIIIFITIPLTNPPN